MKKWPLRWTAVAVLLALVVGCGRGSTDGPKTVPVTGTVKFKGQAVQGAMVVLSPKGTGLRAATGTTDSAGRFELTTLRPGDGAMPGSYAVEISKIEGAAAADAQQEDDPIAASQKAAKEGKFETQGKPEVVKDLLPEKYKKAATSGLTAEVKQQGGNDLQFELTE